jgi:hypothetical protein
MTEKYSKTFKPLNSDDDHHDFDEMMKEVFPTDIPAEFVDQIKVVMKTGQTVMMSKTDILSTRPHQGKIDWNVITQKFSEEIADFEIYMDMKKLKNVVHTNVNRILKKKDPYKDPDYFDKSK